MKNIFKFHKKSFLFLTIILFLSIFFTRDYVLATSCSLYNSGQSIPAGYGASYNLFSAGREVLMNADCSSGSSVHFNIGNGESSQYIYKNGYVWKGGQWKNVQFTPGGDTFGDWLLGSGSADVSFSSGELSDGSYVIAYICIYDNGSWKCGCQNNACAQSYWQLQRFKKTTVPTNPGTPTISCLDNDGDGFDNCSGSNGDGKTLDCDDNERFAFPGNLETCDTVDNNCNGTTDEGCDDDNDGYCDNMMQVYRNNSMCPNTVIDNYTSGENGDDCVDISRAINKGASEVCGNDIDENCDGSIVSNCSTNPSIPTNPTTCTLDGITKNVGESYTFFGSTVSGSLSCAQNSATRTCQSSGTFNGLNIYKFKSCTTSVTSPTTCTYMGITKNVGQKYTFYNVSSSDNCSLHSLERTCESDGRFSGNNFYSNPSCTNIPPSSLSNRQKYQNCYDCGGVSRNDCDSTACGAVGSYCSHFYYNNNNYCYGTCSGGYISGSDYSCKECLIDSNCPSNQICSKVDNAYQCVECDENNSSKCQANDNDNNSQCWNGVCGECESYYQCASGYNCNATNMDCVEAECSNTSSFPAANTACSSSAPLCTPANWGGSSSNTTGVGSQECIECWKNTDCAGVSECVNNECVAIGYPENITVGQISDGSNTIKVSWGSKPSLNGYTCSISVNGRVPVVANIPCGSAFSKNAEIGNLDYRTLGNYDYPGRYYYVPLTFKMKNSQGVTVVSGHISDVIGRGTGGSSVGGVVSNYNISDELRCIVSSHSGDSLINKDGIDNDCDGEFDESEMIDPNTFTTFTTFDLGTCNNTENLYTGTGGVHNWEDYCDDKGFLGDGSECLDYGRALGEYCTPNRSSWKIDPGVTTGLGRNLCGSVKCKDKEIMGYN